MATPTSPNACRTGVASVPPSEPPTKSVFSRHARTCRRAAWAEIHDRTRPPVGIGFAPEMISLAIMPQFHFKRGANDCISDIARACLIGCHRGVGGVFVSAEIVQLMPRPRHCHAQTDFPAIAFRSASPAIAGDQRGRPDGVDLEPHILNSEDRTSLNE